MCVVVHPMRRPAIVRLSSGYRPAVVQLSSGCRPVVVRLSSGCRPAIVRLSSGCRPAVVRLCNVARKQTDLQFPVMNKAALYCIINRQNHGVCCRSSDASSGYRPAVVRLSSGCRPVVVRLSSGRRPAIVRLSSGKILLLRGVIMPSPQERRVEAALLEPFRVLQFSRRPRRATHRSTKLKKAHLPTMAINPLGQNAPSLTLRP